MIFLMSDIYDSAVIYMILFFTTRQISISGATRYAAMILLSFRKFVQDTWNIRKWIQVVRIIKDVLHLIFRNYDSLYLVIGESDNVLIEGCVLVIV